MATIAPMKASAKLASNDKILVEALAGALGGLAATLALYPLDTVKTRIQAEAKSSQGREKGESKSGRIARSNCLYPRWLRRLLRIASDEGAAALYSGATAKSLHSLSSSFLYFYAFSALKRTYEERRGQKVGVGATLLAAALAGCCNVLVTEPLDTYTTRKQTEKKTPSADAAEASTSIAAVTPGKVSDFDDTLKALRGKTKELPGLYSGLGASLTLTINPAIQYTVFEQLRQRLMVVMNIRAQRLGATKPVVELSMFDAFLLGAVSKATATILTYPLVRAKVLQKVGTREEDRKSLIGTLKRVHKEEGVSGMFRGLDAQLVKTVLAGALQMTIKEKSFTSALWLMLLLRASEVE